MKKRFTVLFTGVILIVILLQCTMAQKSLDSLDSDEIFFRARELAFNGKRDSARVLLKMALKKSPDYSDIRILLARTYAWDGRRDEARKELKTVLRKAPNYKDAISASIDVELWDDKPEEALKLCVGALRKSPNDEDYLLHKAKILRILNRDNEALITATILEEINPSNTDVLKFRESIESDFMMQGFTVNETYDWYSDIYDPTHIAYLQYNHATILGTMIARLNVRRRGSKDGFQGEVESYPRIVKGVYAYVSYGFAGRSSSLFPEHRGGLELFFKLPSSFESSIGVRYLNFGPGNDVTMYTGTVGYYYRDYWFSLRPFVTPSSVSFSRSLSFTTRYYYDGSAEEYFSVKIGAGFSPDESNYDPTNGNVYLLKAQSVGIGWQKPIGTISLLTATVDYTNQEAAFRAGKYVEGYSVSVGYRYKF